MAEQGAAVRLGLTCVLVGIVGVAACGKSSSGSGDAATAGAGSTSGASASGGSDSSPAGAPSDQGGRAGQSGGATGGAAGVPACDGNATTRISGKIFDPSMTLPLYGVSVFVPNGPVPAVTTGASCDRCEDLAPGSVVSTTTDTAGSFELRDAPAGQNIPLVVQIGKWRRQLTLSNVPACQELALDPELTRLPRNKSEGDIPRIAITTGPADQMECLPRRLGIDDAEFTTAEGDGRIHLFTGHYDSIEPVTHFSPELNGGAAFTSADTLWGDVESLKKYDLVLLSCEGNTFPNRKPPAMRQAMYDYLSQGGRVLASHWQRIWFSDGPEEVAKVGTWTDRDDPTEDGAPIDATVNQGFPKGKALAEWLVQATASTTPGALGINFARDNLQAGNPAFSREWLTLENPQYPDSPKSVQLLTFTAPVGAPLAQACGRAAFTDLHVSADLLRSADDPLPAGFPLDCEERSASPQEKAIAFTIFELGACLGPEDVP